MLHIVNILQHVVLVVGAFACGIFFQIHENVDSIRDQLGLFYFLLFFWTFDPFQQAVFTMPTEHIIISKEGAS